MDRSPIKSSATVCATVEFAAVRMEAFNAMLHEFRTGESRWDAAQALAKRDAADKLEHGIGSLRRLVDFAERHRTGTSGVVAVFLAALYNGHRFRIDLTELRRLDGQFHQDVLNVLAIAHVPEKELHGYFEGGAARFESLFEAYDLPDHGQAATVVSDLGRFTQEELLAGLEKQPAIAGRLAQVLARRDSGQ